MKTKSITLEIVMILFLVAPFLYLALIWNQLPARIATHYDLEGTPNGWMLKETAALFVGGISLMLYAVLRFLPAIDPKGKLQSTNYQRLRAVVSISFAAIMGWMWYMAGHQNDTKSGTTVMLAIVGLMLAGMGNYLTTVKPNWFVGIRTPWTLENETVWRKTHQLGGRLMMAGGLLAALLALLVPIPYKVAVFVGIILIVSFVPIVYSYIYFRQEKTRQLN